MLDYIIFLEVCLIQSRKCQEQHSYESYCRADNLELAIIENRLLISARHFAITIPFIPFLPFCLVWIIAVFSGLTILYLLGFFLFSSQFLIFLLQSLLLFLLNFQQSFLVLLLLLSFLMVRILLLILFEPIANFG